MWLGAQVVKINADLLHFQPAPSASEADSYNVCKPDLTRPPSDT